MLINPFLNSERQLRNGWWILIFFLVLASLLVPTLIIAQQNSMDVSIGLQAVIILLASWICQLLRRRPLAELLGKFNALWFKELYLGGLVGSALMLVPALVLWIFGWVHWQWNPDGFSTLLSTVLLFAGVALAEELLFRGFIFQRLIAGLGQLPAQLIMAGYFLLTHLNNPGMTGEVKFLASINIFIASLVFGLAFLRTKGLAMPLGLHFMANLVQGGLLGFGVSGTDQSGLLKPVFNEVPVWLTGGQFGLEASVLGLICVVIIFMLIQRWDQRKL
ncbi:type II CAAX endopeptidase family protein [Candidatus Villigracilis saccharophilus]|uniref:CPBP family intramembrane glutamic endopeptidase n=1 Tax=Candidatus Villigracilis saccharophilus TaxID=3140684 RepID=UPI003136AADE|nr:CPBP family intramembrane metalloprotease [Anaerolineales bacterium]